MNQSDPPMELQILVVDDDPDIRLTLAHHLHSQGHQVTQAENGEHALEHLEQKGIDLVITDVRMPGMDGFELLGQIHHRWPQTEVIVATAFEDIEGAVRAIREGAFDYLAKPLDIPALIGSLKRTARFQVLRRENQRFRQQLDDQSARNRQRYGLDTIIGNSPPLQRVKTQVEQVAQADTTSVLICGETGTGKELVARAIHYASARAAKPFIAVDCSAIPPTLVESELFGHKKGAFTDARADRKGYFEQADSGTLFLDEIGDMALEMQTRLLRTLEQRCVRPVGGNSEVTVDVRVVSATHRDLDQAMDQGSFRQDLYYRLNSFILYLPPLRDRPEDIIPLAQHFLGRYNRELRKDISGFTLTAQARLEAYPFPGNIRQLRNIVERAVILCPTTEIQPEELVFERAEAPAPAVGPLPSKRQPIPATGADIANSPASLNLAATEERMVRQALEMTQGNQVQAARLLGISRNALIRRIKRFGIGPDPQLNALS